MKLNLNIEDQKKLKRLFDVRDDNMTVGDILSNFLSDDPSSISPEALNERRDKANLTSEEAFYELMMEGQDIDYKDSQFDQFASRAHLKTISMLKKNDYLFDPYYQDIRFVLTRRGNYSLDENYYLPYEAFLYKDTQADEKDYYREINYLGVFSTRFTYYLLKEKSQVWMSITPHEIETMKEAVSQAHGKVLVLGLGLGYYAYSVSLKDDVSSVTVIDNNADIINLFSQSLLSQMGTKDKIKLVCQDGFKAFKEALKEESFDYVFIDLWHDVDDGLKMYADLKRIEKEENKKGIQVSYWIESSLIIFFRRIVIDLIQEEKEGTNDEDYVKEGNFTDHIINKLHFYLKDREFKTYQEISDFLSASSLKEVISNL